MYRGLEEVREFQVTVRGCKYPRYYTFLIAVPLIGLERQLFLALNWYL